MNFEVEENSHRVLMALKMNIVCIDDSVFGIMEKNVNFTFIINGSLVM